MKNWLPVIMLLLFAGCMNIDYTGRKFTPNDHAVLCKRGQSVDLDKYTLIGRFEVSARIKVHPYEIEDALLEKAGKYGGDLLHILPGKVVTCGVYNTDAEEFGTPGKHKATAAEKKSFGKPAPLSGHNVTYPRRKYTALLYKKSEEVKEQLGL